MYQINSYIRTHYNVSHATVDMYFIPFYATAGHFDQALMQGPHSSAVHLSRPQSGSWDSLGADTH